MISLLVFAALSKFLRVVKADMEREKKGKAGVENLARALQVIFWGRVDH